MERVKSTHLVLVLDQAMGELLASRGHQPFFVLIYERHQPCLFNFLKFFCDIDDEMGQAQDFLLVTLEVLNILHSCNHT